MNWQTGTLSVRSRPEFDFTPKSYEERSVPIPHALLESLSKHKKKHPDSVLIFPTPKHPKRPSYGGDEPDGIAASIFGVVSVLVIADLTRGSGRFNLTLGAIATAVGIGAALSQFIAGSIVRPLGFRAGFLFLAAVALAAFAILYLSMPETRNIRLEDA